MGAQEAYEAILRALDANADRRIVSHFLDEANFGNFLIAFEDRGAPRSIVNDRGQLVVCDGLEGGRGGIAAVQSLREASEQEIIRALNL